MRHTFKAAAVEVRAARKEPCSVFGGSGSSLHSKPDWLDPFITSRASVSALLWDMGGARALNHRAWGGRSSTKIEILRLFLRSTVLNLGRTLEPPAGAFVNADAQVF